MMDTKTWSFIQILLLLVMISAGTVNPGIAQHGENSKLASNNYQVIKSFYDLPVSIHVNGASLDEIFKTLEKEMNLRFLYNPKKIEQSEHTLTLNFSGVNLANVLKEIALQTGLTFRQINGTISVGTDKLRKPEVADSEPAQIIHSVQGVVRDADTGESLPGVNIVVKGTNNSIGTTTDLDGNYTLETSTADDILVFSYVGYQTKEVPVQGRSTLNVELETASILGEELVVVGYGVQEKVNLTGSVGTVEASEIENRPIASVEEALQGAISGLNMVRTGGQPGNQSIDIKIRGTSTFTDNPALIVIDGVPTALNRLDRLNPNDIESISVLKDAASAAIYGSRATGGVILVTTKTGKSGTPQFSFSSTTGLQQPTRFPEKVSALDHALLSNEARTNDGGAPKYTEEDIQRFSSPDWKDYDWDDYMLQNAFQTNQNLSISGGSENHTYYLSIGYLKQDGIVMNTGYERFNIQLNQNIDISDRLKVSLKAGYVPSIRTQSPDLGSMLSDIHVMPKTEPFKTEDGKWLTSNYGTGLRTNPLALGSADAGEERVKSNQISGNLSVDYELFSNLVLTGTYGLVVNQSRDRSYEKLLTLYSVDNPEEVATQRDDNYLDVTNASNTLQNLSVLGNYTNTFGDHKVGVLAGMTAELFEQHDDYVGTRDFLTDNIYAIDAGSSDPSLWSIAGGASEWSLASFLSRVNYSYLGKYLFEAAARYDGASRFAEGLRWGLFPSVSAGWLLTEEDFMQNIEAITFLKIRASWGQVGNQNVGFYPFTNTLSQSAYYFNGSPQRAVATAGAPNPLLTWETKESVNLGLEGSLFENLLEFEVDVFHEKTKDILLQLPLPRTFGQSEPVQNAGRVDNRGWEIQLRHRNTIGDVGYGISLNVSDATNEVIDMGGISPRIQGNTITEEGHPMNEWYGLEADGLFQSDQEVENHAFQNPQTSAGDIRFVDQNGDGEINSDDRIRLGRSDPRFPFGIQLNLNYKSFDFSAFGQGVLSHKVWSSGWTAQNFDRENSTLRTYHLDRWTPENTDARFPKTRFGSGSSDSGVNDRFSSFWLEDASYFRLKNIEIGYNLPTNLLERLSLRGARIFGSAENLFTITDYLGYDPEAATGTGSRLIEGRYPIAGVFNLGINLNF